MQRICSFPTTLTVSLLAGSLGSASHGQQTLQATRLRTLTAEQQEILSRMGCKYAQGFYYSRPVERKSFEEFIKRGVAAPEETALIREADDSEADE